MEKKRTVITTDLECDDMNSLIHLCLHLNELDVEGIVYTASKYHFNGDGEHTLGEVTPHHSCSGKLAYEGRRPYPMPDPNSKYLTEYRPFEEGWIESLFRNEYAEVYPNLCLHDPDYPSPKEMGSRVYYGNIAFEGDVRYPTEGSEFLKKLFLDEDERTLYVQSWGGINTVVRALMSIEEEYKDTDEWQTVYHKVCNKIRILGMINGVGQDNSWKDHAAETWKDVVMLRSEFSYGAFFASLQTQADSVHTYQADWLKENIKFNHGPLMEKTILMGDGTYIKGEPDNRQFGLITTIDWGVDLYPAVELNRYDWLGEGDSLCWVPLLPNGLRGLEEGKYGTVVGRMYNDGEQLCPGYDYLSGKEGNVNPFLYAFQKEWAARADWCVKEPSECTHPPVVSVPVKDIDAAPGETVCLKADVKDADGKGVRTCWYLYRSGSCYNGKANDLRTWNITDPYTKFTVPEDAENGDCFVFYLAAETNSFPSFTRYGEIAVHIHKD